MTQTKTAKPKMGRPTKFTPDMIARLVMLASKGFTDKEAAAFMGITEVSIHNWKKDPNFFKSIKDAKEECDALVQSTLLKRALGFDYTEEFANKDGAVACKRVALPDVSSMIFWLKNRQPKQWRDKIEVVDLDADKNAKTLIQIFRPVREKEQNRIKSGEDPMKVLFRKSFIEKMEKKKNAKPDKQHR